MGDEH